MIEFKARSADGSVTLQETTLCSTLRDKLAGPESSPCSVAVLHAVIGTKTGLVYPSLRVVRALQEEFGERLVVVVDACQLRCKLSMMQEYIQMGAFVLITGRVCVWGEMEEVCLCLCLCLCWSAVAVYMWELYVV